ncbi:unnamed protein product, partial [Thlaspi arvense]
KYELDLSIGWANHGRSPVHKNLLFVASSSLTLLLPWRKESPLKKMDVINLNDENILSDIEMDHANDVMDEDMDHHEANPVESSKLKKDEQEEEKEEEKDEEIEEEKEEEKEES